MDLKEKEFVKQVFSKNKEAYFTSSTHADGSDLELLVEWLSPRHDFTMLDVATGGGHVAKQLSPHVQTVFATDLTKDMLENTKIHLNDYSNIHYIVADAEQLPFLDQSFDMVTCRIAAHHFPNPNKFIKEVQRVLKVGGKFLFIDNVAPEDKLLDPFINKLEKMRDYSHVRSQTITDWETLFKSYNLTITKQISRKKQLPYVEWINRTLDSSVDKKRVKSHILNSSNKVKEYYMVNIFNNNIQSFTIDEWMVMAVKVL
ncbi:class I SAM-dependent methyltransferase [Oceanobacillus halophilus]|uniref:Class I SAM-dependent methyltransferase n=1 Tax=Oceanobacillus halophilus TaxID=930130 RepID=A0A495AC02_9BACI|nr:class I SAM-dependent methyltransferase [Oceanobacillus halophilus]RKQ37422.1 class I SAM-dependent methyltransferase [Oceanobacillus halophilus]